MSILSWFRGHGIAGSSDEIFEDSEPDYGQMTPEQIELRERTIHRVMKLDKLASDLDKVDNRRHPRVTPIGLSETSEVVWPKPNAGYDSKAFRPCVQVKPFEAQQIKMDFVIRTKNGPIRGNAGDFIVRMPNGDMLVFKPATFNSLFKIQ